MEVAVGKAIDHRSISASRSVEKLAEYAWLLGHDKLAAEMIEDHRYPMYGCPALKHMADTLGWQIDEMQNPLFVRMAEGLPCHDGCDEGCGHL
jgi:hypothetical protein